MVPLFPGSPRAMASWDLVAVLDYVPAPEWPWPHSMSIACLRTLDIVLSLEDTCFQQDNRDELGVRKGSQGPPLQSGWRTIQFNTWPSRAEPGPRGRSCFWAEEKEGAGVA